MSSSPFSWTWYFLFHFCKSGYSGFLWPWKHIFAFDLLGHYSDPSLSRSVKQSEGLKIWVKIVFEGTFLWSCDKDATSMIWWIENRQNISWKVNMQVHRLWTTNESLTQKKILSQKRLNKHWDAIFFALSACFLSPSFHNSWAGVHQLIG